MQKLRDANERLAIRICQFAHGHENCFCANNDKPICASTEKFARYVRDFCNANPE